MAFPLKDLAPQPFLLLFQKQGTDNESLSHRGGDMAAHYLEARSGNIRVVRSVCLRCVDIQRYLLMPYKARTGCLLASGKAGPAQQKTPTPRCGRHCLGCPPLNLTQLLLRRLSRLVSGRGLIVFGSKPQRLSKRRPFSGPSRGPNVSSNNCLNSS